MSIEDLNREMFNNSADYLRESRSELPKTYADFIIDKIQIEEKAKILDVGCGLGFLSKLIAEGSRAKVFGIDQGSDLIKEARNLHGKYAHFLFGDAYNINFDDNKFNLTICQTLFIHLSDPGRVIQEMIRVTKPKGKIVAIEPLIFADGSDKFAPGEAAKKISARSELFQYEINKKLEGGIDLRIALKIPYLFGQYGLSEIKIHPYTIVNFINNNSNSQHKKPKNIEKPNLSAYDKMILSLGYPEDKLKECISLEKRYASTPGEISVTTMLLIEGVKTELARD